MRAVAGVGGRALATWAGRRRLAASQGARASATLPFNTPPTHNPPTHPHTVWYHMCSGRKVFLAAPPTPHNLAAYERWAGSGRQVRALSSSGGCGLWGRRGYARTLGGCGLGPWAGCLHSLPHAFAPSRPTRCGQRSHLHQMQDPPHTAPPPPHNPRPPPPHRAGCFVAGRLAAGVRARGPARRGHAAGARGVAPCGVHARGLGGCR